MEQSEFLRPCEVARRLNLSTKAVRKLLRGRQLPGFRQNGLWLIPRASLEDYLAAMKAKADGNVDVAS
jgi:excisionase family DNA binding protein